MTMMMPRSDFIGLADVIHLAAGGESPMLQSSIDVIRRFAMDKAAGYTGGYSGRGHIYEVYSDAKRRLARLLGGVDSADIALLSSVSGGASLVASNVPWQPGDNVVTLVNEFPSLILPWLRGLGRLGLEVISPLSSAARGPNVCFKHSGGDAVVRRLKRRKVLAWGGGTRVRLSLHGYVSEADVRTALNELQRVLNA